MALQSSVTRTDSDGNVWGPKQRITIVEHCGRNSARAYASYEEKRKGSIEPVSSPIWSCGGDPYRGRIQYAGHRSNRKNDGRRGMGYSSRKP